ncbi:MAG: Mur ligase domain-containing protein [Methylobacter sp.]|jgi:UDP-N-acetylmuramoyl-tripeptide--D-alanyl-D-alanine ligase|nr:Mur ligase domain-containing protein [Methylobacter sp.]
MNMMPSEIVACVQGKPVGDDVAILSVCIDTRAIQPGQLYVAIKGHNFEGNEFVGEVEQAGAIAAIVHQGITATAMDGGSVAISTTAWKQEVEQRMENVVAARVENFRI